ncbi:MAG: DNRLRE domain-containing protein, partial [Planctomycetota bacterium]|nr:DNRLRE domain-containing protein [Planctomycetota bacterium]
PFAPYSRDHGYSLTPGQAGQYAEAVQFLARWSDGTLSTDLKTIVLSTLVPMENRQQDVEDFNAAVVALSEDLSEGLTAGAPIRVAISDPYSLFQTNPALFTYGAGDWMTDSLHPNTIGYNKMADILFGSIKAASTDFVRPAPIHDLAVVSSTDTTVTLSFTATGDDGDVGKAARYDLRVGTDSIDKHSFGRTTQFVGEPAVATAGTSQTIVVDGLLSGTAYEFALKTSDLAGNRSEISNVASAATTGSTTTIFTLQAGLNGYRGVEDNTLTSVPANSNMGGHASIYSGLIGMSTTRRGVLRFDLDFLPNNVEVVDARLRLYNHGSESGAPADLSVYRLTKRWVQGEEGLFDREGTSSWSSNQWTYQTWSAPGADQADDSARNDDPAYDRLATPEATIAVTSINAWYEWDVTAAAAHWVSRDWNNEGLLLKTDLESAGSGRHFHSSEYSTDPSLRPTLIITVKSADN